MAGSAQPRGCWFDLTGCRTRPILTGIRSEGSTRLKDHLDPTWIPLGMGPEDLSVNRRGAAGLRRPETSTNVSHESVTRRLRVCIAEQHLGIRPDSAAAVFGRSGGRSHDGPHGGRGGRPVFPGSNPLEAILGSSGSFCSGESCTRYPETGRPRFRRVSNDRVGTVR